MLHAQFLPLPLEFQKPVHLLYYDLIYTNLKLERCRVIKDLTERMVFITDQWSPELKIYYLLKRQF